MRSDHKIIFIISLERSGSTLLDMRLGKEPDLVSFGEVSRVLQPHGAGIESVYDRRCSCGALAKDCTFWSTILKEIDAGGQLTLKQRYNIFFKQFDKIYGEQYIPVDSSKMIKTLDELSDMPNVETKVVFTMRDVRGWMYSNIMADKRTREIPYAAIYNKEKFISIWRAYLRINILRKFPFWLPVEWWYRNRRIGSFLKSKNIEYVNTSYERFVFDNSTELRRIIEFAGKSRHDSGGNERLNEHHVIRGNRTAFSNSVHEIKYDKKWLNSYSVMLRLIPFPMIFKFNRKNIYEIES